MERRLWPYAATALLAVALVAIAFVAGRGSASDSTPTAQTQAAAGTSTAATKTVDGIPVGTQRTRAGALAAVDNYVALGIESIIQNPDQYERLVRQAWTPEYQTRALEQAKRTRDADNTSQAEYAAGAKAVAIIAARRINSYDNQRAETTTWAGFMRWGPSVDALQAWQLTEVTLEWREDRWRVSKLRSVVDERPVPAPTQVQSYSDESRTRGAFERELRGMTAPQYGAAG